VGKRLRRKGFNVFRIRRMIRNALVSANYNGSQLAFIDITPGGGAPNKPSGPGTPFPGD
jgi:hypothetical protein